MADKKGLQIIGFIFGAITATIVSIAAVGIVNASDGGLNETYAFAAPVLPVNGAR